jgi:ABC-type transport system involved in cytochrome bd biosynthesis fused ATPase/permease subunit
MLALLQFGTGVIFAVLLPIVARADASVRRTRSDFVATVVTVATTAREVRLLNADAALRHRVGEAQTPLEAAERRLARLRSVGTSVVVASTLLTVVVLWRCVPTLSATGLVAAVWIALATMEQIDTVPAALDSLVAVIGAGERLDELAGPSRARPVTTATGEISVQWSATTPWKSLGAGQRVAVVGPSGAGKTRLLERLAGLEDGDTGLRINGHDIATIDEQLLRRVVRYVPANPGLVRGVVRDTLGLGAPVTPALLAMAHRLGLNLALDDRIDDLSRGERQRFALVRALATSPRLLLLDEPTSGLGHEDTERVLSLLSELPVVTIVASHDPDVVAWCHEVVAVDDLAV